MHANTGTSDVVDGDKICYLTQIPSELINLIFTFLRPFDLAQISATCRSLSKLTDSDLLWQRHVQNNVPGVIVKKPYPCQTFRELYKAHDPHWFLPKYKVWFNDFQFTGKIILTRYDPRRGCIDGYRLVAERPAPTFSHWEGDDQVVVHSFEPKCKLHLDQPLVQLNALSLETLMSSSGRTSTATRYNAEIPMRLNERYGDGVFSNFLMSRHVEDRPGMDVWPPRTIPGMQRVRAQSQEGFVGVGHKPSKRSEICETTFRIRRWMEMQAGPYVPGLHLGEEVYTYSTLDPHLYTPTEEKPFRGIWVGDYSGHGCEFLLLHQPDDEVPFDESAIGQEEDETTEEWEERKKEERIYRGKLEAIKLTGDPNIPRGEITFSADDIGRGGFVRRAEDNQFKGARIVRSRGQIANRGFRNGESHLLYSELGKIGELSQASFVCFGECVLT